MGQLPESWNPFKPTCPNCGTQLRLIIGGQHYPEDQCTMLMFKCECCSDLTAVVIMDNHQPGTPYKVKTLEEINND